MTSPKWMFCFFVAFSLLFSLETVSGQVLRRPLQRLSGLTQQQNPGYRVSPPADRSLRQEKLVQGDGRLLERVQNFANNLTAQGSSELKPVAVISAASFEEYKRVIQTVAQKIRLNSGSTEEPALLNTFLNIYGQIVSRGFDTQQPMGLVLMTDGLLYYPLFFTPLDLNSKLGQSILNDYTQRLPDGRYVLRQDKFHWALGQLYVQQKNGWVFIATETLLNSLPDDPTVLLQGMEKKHLLAAKFELQNFPVLSTRAALTFGEMSAVAKAESEFDKASARLSFGYLRSLAEQADVLEHTFSYDEENNDYILEQKESVKPKTDRAKLLQQRRAATSIFGGFYHPQRAILASHFVMDLTKPQRKELETILNEAVGKHLLTEEEQQRQKETETGKGMPAEGKSKEEAAATPDSDDHRNKLAALLAMVPPEDFAESETREEERIKGEEGEKTFNHSSLYPLSFPSINKEETFDEPQKLKIVLRRIGVAYYWAFIGAIRSGHFDGASTWSAERGMLGAFKITEGKQFAEAFDSIFAEVKDKFPDFYVKNIEKDFAESSGFRLTAITFDFDTLLKETLKNSFLKSIIPEEFSQRKVRLLLGVRDDAVCYAFGEGTLPDQQIAAASAGTSQAKSVDEMFFIFSGYELGQAFAASGHPDRFVRLKTLAANTDPKALAYAVASFTDTSKTITLRISGLLTPSLWNLRNQ